MGRHASTLKKVAAIIEKKQSSQSLGKSFTIILETPSPDYQGAPTFEQTHIRTKGYQPNEHTEHTEHTSNQQTSEVQEND